MHSGCKYFLCINENDCPKNEAHCQKNHLSSRKPYQELIVVMRGFRGCYMLQHVSPAPARLSCSCSYILSFRWIIQRQPDKSVRIWATSAVPVEGGVVMWNVGSWPWRNVQFVLAVGAKCWLNSTFSKHRGCQNIQWLSIMLKFVTKEWNNLKWHNHEHYYIDM